MASVKKQRTSGCRSRYANAKRPFVIADTRNGLLKSLVPIRTIEEERNGVTTKDRDCKNILTFSPVVLETLVSQ